LLGGIQSEQHALQFYSAGPDSVTCGRLIRLAGRVQIIVHGDIEIHEFGSFRIIHSGDVEMRSRERGGDVLDVEKEKSGLRAVGFDGVGGELRRLDLVSFFLSDCAFYLIARKRQRHLRLGAALRIHESPVNIVGGIGSELGVVGRGQRDLHVGDRNGLRTLVGHDEKDGKKAVIVEVDAEDFGLFGSVVGIGGDGDLFIAVVIVRGISFRGLGLRFDEIFILGGKRQGKYRDTRGEQKETEAPAGLWQHAIDYRTEWDGVEDEDCGKILSPPKTRGNTAAHGVWLEWLNLIPICSFFYSVVLAVGMLVSLPYWLFQMAFRGKYSKGLLERMGRVPARLRLPGSEAKVIWVHAVSVGEVQAVTGLVELLKDDPSHFRIFVSTTTDTGQALARKRFGEESVFYFPMDLGFAIRPYLRALRPSTIVVAETEFWPNFLRCTHASGARTTIVNARISDRSWPHYRRFRWLLRRVLANVDLFLAQSNEDAARLLDIGACAERVRVAGNLKFDVASCAAPEIVQQLRSCIAAHGSGPVLVCGSTVAGEEPLLLKAFENVLVQHSRAVMILAPRHPERFDAVAALMETMSIRFWRRSLWNGEDLSAAVLLLDTIGELSALYALAGIAFVGGSLVPRGGHNIIEPAQHGVAIVTGNHTENFRDIVKLFQSRGALRVAGPAELPLALMELLNDGSQREALGARAAETMRSQAGATTRTAGELRRLLAKP
jgi:3-deoxy-D-manno-octulosonic-acid transferase